MNEMAHIFLSICKLFNVIKIFYLFMFPKKNFFPNLPIYFSF